MKKQILLFSLIATFISASTYAQTWIEDVYLYEDFSTATGSWVDGTPTQGVKTGGTLGTNTFTSAINTTNKNVEIKTNVKIGNFISNVKTFSGTAAPYTSPSGKVTVSFICKIGTAQTYSGAYFYFRDDSNKPIFGLGFARINADGNKWLAVRPTSYIEWLTDAASYPNITTAYLMPTNVDAPALKVTVVLDFNTKSYNMTAIQGTYTANGSPEWVDATTSNVYTGTNVAFLDNAASNVANVLFEANGNQTSSSATATNFTFDNFKIAGEKESAGFGNVTVKYQDADGNSLSAIKTDVLHEDLPAGSTYPATDDEKANFNDGSFYYVYDATITTDNVTVVENATTELILKFRKFPLLTSTNFTWTGTVNGLWNELNQNFTSDGTNSLGYQNTNGVIFPSTASNKTVSLNSTVDLGTQDLTISGSGYNLTTGVLGNITGTGAMNINLSGTDVLSLGVTNNLTDVTQISGGTITVNKAGSLGVTPNITGATTIIAGTGQTFPAMTFGASSTIQGGTYVNTINGMSAPSGVKIGISSSHNTNNDYAFDFAASGTLSSGSELELTGTATETKFGMTSASATYLANAKVSLKGTAFLFLDVNQGSASTINVGTLSGESGTKLGWGKSSALDRHITWSVGANNENSEFAGTITNLGGYATGGSFYTGRYTHLTKVGTGKLTLSGTSNAYNGDLTVNGGEVLVSGTLRGNNQATTPLPNTVTVAPNAKLTVTGNLTATNLVINSNENGTGTLVNTGTVSITNPATVNQYLPSASERTWWYLSSPVTGATSDVFASNLVGSYDETTRSYTQPFTQPTTLEKGKGYVVKMTATEAAIYKFENKTLNDGDISLTLNRSITGTLDSKRGFNLVGNPYPSYIDWDEIHAESMNIRDAIWFRTYSGGRMTFHTYSDGDGVPTGVSGKIAPMQAFWVRVDADPVSSQTVSTGTLTFKNTHRSHFETGANPLKVKAEDIRQRLRLVVSNGTATDETLLVGKSYAQDVQDSYDIEKMTNSNPAIPEIYSLIQNEELVINSMNALSEGKTVELGFRPGQAGNFTIRATQLQNIDAQVVLVDNLTGAETDLTAGETYSFDSGATDTNSRFSVLFRVPGSTTGVQDADYGWHVNTSGSRMVITGTKAGSLIRVYNIMGQQLISAIATGSHTELSSNFTPGLYLVKVNNQIVKVTAK